MKKEELLIIVQDFLAVFKERANSTIQSYLPESNPEISLDQPDSITDKLVHKWFKYLKATQTNEEETSFSTILEYEYNLEPFILQNIIRSTVIDPRFSLHRKSLITEAWLPENFRNFANIWTIKFFALILNIILEIFSFEEVNETFAIIESRQFDPLPEYVSIILPKLEYLCKDYLEIELFYFIFGIELTDFPELFDESYQIRSEQISLKDIEKLTKRLNIGVPYDDNNSKLWNITSLSHLLTRTIRVERKELYDEMNTRGKRKRKVIDFRKEQIFPASFLEQAFHLLGHTQVRIIGYSQTHRYEPYEFGIDFHPDGFGYHSGTPSMTDWDFSTMPFFREKKNKILYTPEMHTFLREFPKKIWTLPKLSLLSNVFHRYRRLQSATYYYDKIMESMIILDGIFTEGKDQLSYQIRMKTPWLLSNNPEDRVFWKKIVQDLYLFRSKFVHMATTTIKSKNKSKSKNEMKNDFGTDWNAALYATEIVRAIMLQLIQLDDKNLSLQNIKDLRMKLEQAGLGIAPDLKPSFLFTQYAQKNIQELKEKLEKK